MRAGLVVVMVGPSGGMISPGSRTQHSAQQSAARPGSNTGSLSVVVRHCTDCDLSWASSSCAMSSAWLLYHHGTGFGCIRWKNGFDSFHFIAVSEWVMIFWQCVELYYKYDSIEIWLLNLLTNNISFSLVRNVRILSIYLLYDLNFFITSLYLSSLYDYSTRNKQIYM